MPLELKSRDGIWYVIGSYDGRRYRRSTKTARRREAEIFLKKFRERLVVEKASGVKSERTFNDAVRSLLMRDPTWGDQRFMSPIVAKIGKKKIHEVGNEVILNLAAELYPGKPASTLKRQVWTPVKRVCNHAAELEWCPPKKWMKVEVETKDRDWLLPSQVDELLSGVTAAHRRYLTVLFGTGMRASEALGLRWRHVTPEAQFIVLDASITKKKYVRSIWIQPLVRQALGERGAPEDRVFPEWNHYTTVNRYLHRRAAEGLPAMTNHTARHSWATWTYAMSKDIHYLMRNGGWRDADIVMTYNHYATPDVATEARKYGWTWQHGDTG